MSSRRIVGDCRDAAKALRDSFAFPTGQSILFEAAQEIERLRRALYLYGDRKSMANALAILQPSIDTAMAMCESEVKQ